MIATQTFIKALERIARNDGKSRELTHHDITVLAHGLLKVMEDTSIPNYADVEMYLIMLTKKAPHHARSLLAMHCIEILRSGDESSKKPVGATESPANF